MSLESAAPNGADALQEKLTETVSETPQAGCSPQGSDNTTCNSERALSTEEDTRHEKADKDATDNKMCGAEHGARPRDTKRPYLEPAQDIKVFAKENRIAYKTKNSFCVVCDVEIPSTAELIRVHVFGKKHKKAVAPKAEEEERIKVHPHPHKDTHKKKNIYSLQEKLTETVSETPQAGCSPQGSDNTTCNSERALSTEEDTRHEKADKDATDNKMCGAEHGARPRDTKRPYLEPAQDIKVFAKENRIAYKTKNSYCVVCDVEIPSTAELIRVHVFGKKHKKAVAPKAEEEERIKVHPRPHKDTHKKKNIYESNLEKNILAAMSFLAMSAASVNAPTETISLRFFVKSVVSVFEPQKMVINKRFCVDWESFHFYCQVPLMIRCVMCEYTFDPRSNSDGHTNDDRHINAVWDSHFLQIKDEFIRMMRRDLYQCGYCNLVADWKNMRLHLQSLEHCDAKRECKIWLEQLLPVVRRHLRSLNPWEGPMSGTSIHGDIFLPR